MLTRDFVSAQWDWIGFKWPEAEWSWLYVHHEDVTLAGLGWWRVLCVCVLDDEHMIGCSASVECRELGRAREH